MPSGTGFGGRTSRPYRKYRPLPMLILIALLGFVSVFVWLKALANSADIEAAVRCDPPARAPSGVVYTPMSHDALDDVTPIPPDKVAVQVLNAGDARGQASLTTEALRQLGFSQVGKPANDPAYEDRTAHCRGQIRYGENGASAARTVSLIDPCVELIKDNRKDATVDLAIGTAFGDVRPQPEARTVLEQLSSWSQERKGTGGGELSTGDKAPSIDPDLLEAAHTATC
ncbi:MAG: envelope integrity protein Cei [Haloechinothrix sp.]